VLRNWNHRLLAESSETGTQYLFRLGPTVIAGSSRIRGYRNRGAEPTKIKELNLDGEKLSVGERREIESLGRKFTKLKERDKGLVRLLVAKLAQATS
jgi:hypothetical protein